MEWRNVWMNLQIYRIPEDFKKLSRVSGVYFLTHKGSIEYIGRSVNINNRLNSHHIFDRCHHDEVWVYPIPMSWHNITEKQLELIRVEDALIKELKPEKNIHAR